jgi:two-component system, NarL family, nitrate/nitrite response regulator NarL
MKRIRLVVVDDHALFRAGLVSLLGEMIDFQVLGEAGNGRDALEIIENVNPDIVLLDVNMPVMNGVETVKALKQSGYKGHIVMLTISKHEEDLFGAIQAGADGYLLKNSEPHELRKALTQVSAGQSVISPEVTRPLLKAVAQNQGIVLDGGLSRREVEVLEYLAQGKTTIQIAEELYVSENTIKTHVRHILGKMEASNRAEAVSKATQMGLIKPARLT